MMGMGKTSAAIKLMNEDTDRKYVFITPFLDEVKRIKQGCPERKFIEPVDTKKSKSENLLELLEGGRNIASTHALFKRCTPYTASLLSRNKYVLILDEVCDVIETLDLSRSDLAMFLKRDIISVSESGRVYWNEEDYGKDGSHIEVMRSITNGHVIMENNKLLIWEFPFSIFDAFDEVIILTYMFNHQFQKYYFDIHNAEFEYIGVKKVADDYEFCPVAEMGGYAQTGLTKLINVIDDEKLNECGVDSTALSANWFEKQSKVKGQPGIERLKLNAENLVRNRWNVLYDQILWSTHKDAKEKIQGKGYTRSFLSFNYRATNAYRDRKYLMYLINIYPVVDLCNFFKANGVTVNEDGFATSVMIQWIWRSAIRDGNEIWLYMPSSRMRALLQKWLEEVNK